MSEENSQVIADDEKDAPVQHPTGIVVDPEYIFTIDRIKELAGAFKAKIRLQQEPIDETRNLITLLQQVVVNQENLFKNNEASRNYFFDDGLDGIVKTLAQLIKIKVNNHAFLDYVRQIPILIAHIASQNIHSALLMDSIKYLFDHQSRIHKYHFLTVENAILQQTSPESYTAEERVWRESLATGSELDSVKIDPNQKLQKIWSKCVVKSIREDTHKVLVSFFKDLITFDREISIYSQEIAQLGTHSTEEISWRAALKSGDNVDCWDSTGFWYASTILQIQEREFQGSTLEMAYIGYRVMHQDGDKADDNENKFFGWEDKYDDWVPLYSACLSKYQSYTDGTFKNQTNAAQNSQNTYLQKKSEDKSVDDSLDMTVTLERGEMIYAVERNECRSEMLTEFINTFGRLGGFDRILQRVQERNEDQNEMVLVSAYVECLAKSAPNYHKQIVDSFFQPFIDAVLKSMLLSTPQQLRVTKKERFDDVTENIFKKLTVRIGNKSLAQAVNDKLLFTTDLGIHFLSQTFLDKRIDGIKVIGATAQACVTSLRSSASGAATATITTDETKLQVASTIVTKLMDDNFILQELFSKDKTHSQLLQRSEKVLKLLMMQNAFDDSHRDILWKQVQTNDDDARVEMLKTMIGAAEEMQEADKLFFLAKIKQIPYQDIIERHIQLVTEIGTVRQTATQDNVKQQVLSFLWHITFESNNQCDITIVNRSSLAFSAAIRGLDFNKQIGYIYQLIENLKQNKQGYLVLKTLGGLLKGSCDPPTNSEEYKSLGDVINHLEGKFELLQTIFDNFKDYMKRVKQVLDSGEFSEVDPSKLDATVISDLFMHGDQVTLRLELIRFYATSSPDLQLQTKHLENLWDLIIVNSPVEKDEKQMYKWLREVTDQVQRLSKENVQPVVSMEQLIDFYHSRIASNNEVKDDKYKLLSIEGYQCRQSFFVLINQTQGKLRRVTWESGMYKSEKPQPQQQSDNFKQKATKSFTSFNNQTGATYSSYEFNNTGEQGTSTQGTSDQDPIMQTANEFGPPTKEQATSVYTQAQTTAAKNDKDVDPDDLEVESLVSPLELDGMNMIWRIATESTSKSVIDSTGKLLVSLHHGVSAGLRKRIPEFDDIYINKTFEIIEEQIPLIKARSQEDKDEVKAALAQLSQYASTIQVLKVTPPPERKIVRSLFLLRQMIRASEKDSTFGLRPHSALSRSSILSAIQISNSINHSQGYRSRFDLALGSNATVWDLKRRIGEEIMKTSKDDGKTWDFHPKEGETELPRPFHPSCIRIFQMVGTKDIQDLNHGSTLSELNFKNNETLGVFKKSVHLTQKKAVLVEYNAELDEPVLTEIASQVSQEIFNRFSITNDQGLRVMGVDQLIKYTEECTTTKCDAKDHRIVNFMTKYDPKNQSYFLCEDLQKFYVDAIKTGSELTLRNNFENLGYGPNLKNLPLHGDEPNSQQVRKSAKEMPRFKVSQNQKQFNTLMSLLEFDGEVSKKAVEAINMHATNPVLFKKVKSIENFTSESENFDWDSLFEGSNVHSMLYTLEIIEAMLMGDSDNEFMKNWITNFIAIGGLQQLQSRLTNALNNVEKHQDDAYKKYIDQLLKLVRIFVTASTSIKKEEPSAEKDKEPEENDKDPTTPTKPIKRHLEAQNVEVTQETLFDGQDPDAENIQIIQKIENNAEDEPQDLYSNLKQILASEGMHELVSSKVDLEMLKAQSIKVVDIFIVSKNFDIKDRHIVESAMQLWEAIHSDSTQSSEVPFDKDLLVRGLIVCQEKKVRECFRDSISRIGKNQEVMFKFLLDFSLDIVSNISKQGTTTWQFFGMLRKLISNSSDKIAAPENEFLYNLIEKLITLLSEYNSNENKKSLLSDQTLQGSLETIADALQQLKEDKTTHQAVLDLAEKTNMINILFYRCLFFQEGISEQYMSSNLAEVQRTRCQCASKESRKSGFRVLKEFINFLKPKQMVELIQNQIMTTVKDVQRPKKWRHLPSSQCRENGYCGIVNLGCICYMISVMQQFFMVPQFRYQIMKAVDTSPVQMGEFKDEQFDDNLLRQLQMLYGYLELSERHAGSAKGMCFSYKDYDGTPTKIGEQKDSQEFLNFFIDRLEEQLKPTSQKDLLKDIFRGQSCEQMICESCNRVSSRLVNFYCLSLDVKGYQGVHPSLQNMKKGETIEDYQCEGCKQKVNVNKRSLLGTMPNILVLHLKRFVFSFDTYQNEKVNSCFEFPRILDLKNYSVKGSMEDSPDEEIKKLLEADDDDYVYRLVGINIQEGTADAGHYYSIINTKRGTDEADPYKEFDKWQKVENNPWKEFNDASVNIFSFEKNIEKEAFGGDQTSKNQSSDAMNDQDLASFLGGSGAYGKSAYMLFYERKKKHNLTEYTDEKQEETKIIDYRQVEKVVPDWIAEIVKNDNKSFLVDSQVFDDQFFDFLKEITKFIGSELVLTSHQYAYEYNMKYFPVLKTLSLELVDKVVMDMLAYYDRNTSAIVGITNSASSIMTFCDSKYDLKSGKTSLVVAFLKRILLDDQGDHFFKIMFTCSDQNSRINIGKLVQFAVVRLIKLYDDCEQELKDSCQQVIEVKQCIDSTLDLLFNALKDKECQRNWTKLEAYFDTLLNISTSSLSATQIVLDHYDLITDLIDFILGNKSPRAADETEKRLTMGGVISPPFYPLYTLISMLVRMTYTSQMNLEERLDTHFQVTSDDLKNTQAKTYFLSDEAMIMLTKTDFLEKVIFETKYENVGEFARALSHLCYKNIKMSRKVCKKLLKAVSYSSNDQVSRHLGILLQIAQIKDEFQIQRLEYLFGFGFLMHYQNEENPLLQYGAEIMKNTTQQEVYAICSPIDTRIYDDALLNLLWKYKGRMDSFTLSCLESLGNLILNDDLILDFFSNIPAPHYNMGRYTDWVLPYLAKQKEDSLKFSSGSGSQEKLQTIANIQQMFESYEQILNELKNNEKLYIVTSVESEEIASQNTFDEAVELTVYMIHAKYIESIPTGTGNMSMDFSKQGKNEVQKMQDSAISGNMQSSNLQAKGTEEEAKELLQTSFELKELSCKDLLYRVHAKNLMQSNVQIKIDFVPTDASQQIDLIYPHGGLKDYLKPDADFPILTIRRKNPFTADENAPPEMSKLNISLKWKTYGSDDYTVCNYSTSLNKPESKNSQVTLPKAGNSSVGQRRNAVQIGIGTNLPTQTDDYEKAETLDQAIEAVNQAEGRGSMKTCSFCTLKNPAENTNCSLCDGIFG